MHFVAVIAVNLDDKCYYSESETVYERVCSQYDYSNEYDEE